MSGQPQQPSSPVSVMISYSRSDSDFTKRLWNDLKGAGFPTWMDTRSIPGGRQWAKELYQAIDEAQVVLVVMSPAAMKSKWVRRECAYARRHGKVVIPLDYFPCDIPADLARRQTISFRPNFVNAEAYYTQQFGVLTTTIAGYASLDTTIPLPARPRLGRRLLSGALGVAADAVLLYVVLHLPAR